MQAETTEALAELTPKQEAFALAYVECGNASEAYRRSYDVSPTAKPEGIWVNACKLLSHTNVALRVMQLKEAHAKRHEVTVDSLTEMLKEDRELARKENEPNAAIKAVEVLAKLHGHMVEKKVVTSDNRHHHSAEPVSPFNDFVAAAIGARTEGETEKPVQN
jgi:phage terminase small subunit